MVGYPSIDQQDSGKCGTLPIPLTAFWTKRRVSFGVSAPSLKVDSEGGANQK